MYICNIMYIIYVSFTAAKVDALGMNIIYTTIIDYQVHV